MASGNRRDGVGRDDLVGEGLLVRENVDDGFLVVDVAGLANHLGGGGAELAQAALGRRVQILEPWNETNSNLPEKQRNVNVHEIARAEILQFLEFMADIDAVDMSLAKRGF